MLFSDVINLFRQGVLDIDCKRIVIERNISNGPRYIGNGYIRQTKSGGLEFKIYVHETHNTEYCVGKPAGRTRPRVYSNEMLFSLTAAGYDGTQWTAGQILPFLHRDATDGSVRATGEIANLKASEPANQPRPYVRLHFFEQCSIPLKRMTETEHNGDKHWVRNKVEFDAIDSKFEVRRQDNDTVFEIRSDNTLPPSFHLRLQEALQFITAKPTFWRARLAIEEGDLSLELASPIERSGHPRLRPPIAPSNVDFELHGWKLFAKYLEYLVTANTDTYWNKVAYHVHNACEATANSIDAAAVGVSVAVEALAGLVSQPDPANAEQIAEFKSRIQGWLNSQPDFHDLKRRMEGLINALGEERVKDKLHFLAAKGRVEPAYIKSWTHLRNRHVHPKLRDLRKPELEDTRKLIEQTEQVTVLLNQLIFHLIDYNGPFTDYGLHDFPSKSYPLTPTVSFQ